MSDSLRPHGLQHGRLPRPSLSPRVCSNSCPLSWWCHSTISSSVAPLSLSFPMSRLFASGGRSIGASALASVFPMNVQGWFPLGSVQILNLIMKRSGVPPWWSSGREFAFQDKDAGSNPNQGTKIPHASELTPCAASTEPRHHMPRLRPEATKI